MNRFQQKAIELRYEGYTAKEISEAMGGVPTRYTIENWFRHDGLLYFDYLKYVAKMQKWGEERAREKIRKSAAQAGDVLDELLKQAMQSGQLDLAFQIVVKQLAIAGIVEQKQIKIMEEKHYDTVDDFVAELRARGIDPLTGLSERAKQLLEEGKIPN